MCCKSYSPFSDDSVILHGIVYMHIKISRPCSEIKKSVWRVKSVYQLDEALEILHVEDLDSSDSGDEEDIPLERADIVPDILSDTWLSYRPLLPLFSANMALNIGIADSDDMMAFVNIFITVDFIEYIREQNN